jgi:Ion channel
MRDIAIILGVALLLIVLWDSFETIVLPRRVRRRLRLTYLFYAFTWRIWSTTARRLHAADRRDNFLSYYGPLSLIMLLGVWAISLALGFALLHWGLGSMLLDAQGNEMGFGGALYMSGSTLFTLGMGDITPRSTLARALTVAEAGTGIAFLALVIGYLPVIYQAFSRREVNISLLDARAGSPPSAGELLRRHAEHDTTEEMVQFLRDWERWSSELLESHLSYPVLAYYRSQHDRESWLTALTMLLDVSALVIVGVDGIPVSPARLAFAMARHAAVDLSQVFDTPPLMPHHDRLPPTDLMRLREMLADAGMALREGSDADQKLTALRAKYEPYVNALAEYLLVALPPWLPETDATDDWQTSVWEHASTAPLV